MFNYQQNTPPHWLGRGISTLTIEIFCSFHYYYGANIVSFFWNRKILGKILNLQIISINLHPLLRSGGEKGMTNLLFSHPLRCLFSRALARLWRPFTASPRHSSNKFDSALGLIAALARLYSLYGYLWCGSVLYVGAIGYGLSEESIDCFGA